MEMTPKESAMVAAMAAAMVERADRVRRGRFQSDFDRRRMVVAIHARAQRIMKGGV